MRQVNDKLIRAADVSDEVKIVPGWDQGQWQSFLCKGGVNEKWSNLINQLKCVSSKKWKVLIIAWKIMIHLNLLDLG